MLLDKKTFVVKERVAFAKLTATYDILDAESGAVIGVAKEEPGALAKWARLVVSKWKGMLPTAINVYEGEGTTPILTLRRGFTMMRASVTVSLGDRVIGSFKAKALSIGGAFQMFDPQENEIGAVKGDWKGWNFQMVTPSGEELGRVTKTWAGLGKALFTNADNYVIALAETATGRPDIVPMLLAAGLAIDVVFREKR